MLLVWAAGCGGAPKGPESALAAERREPERAATKGADPLQIEGLLGSLSQVEIHRALDPRLPRFARCLGQRNDVVPWLSGSIAMRFRVATDGSVRSVWPTASELGDRATERCLLGVAASTQFPAPHGGEAEFDWSLEAPADSDVRPADAYAFLDRALPTLASAVQSCAAPELHVTAYVDDAGQVVAAGASSPAPVSDEALDCVTTSLVGVTIISPGSYAAKLRTRLP